VRASALVVAATILAGGCASSGVSDEERAEFDRRIQRELAAGRARKARIIAENRRVLDALPRIPGSKQLGEFQNPEDDAENGADVELEMYASEKLPYSAYADMTSTGWGTFREYSIPRGMTTADVNEFFVRRLGRRWRLAVEPARRGIYLLSFARGRRCVWFHIGTRTSAELRGEVPPGRSYEVATDVRTGDACPGGAE
jgi:hypothetical protein